MKSKQRQKDNKVVHMAIQPVRQLFGESEHRSSTNKHTNTQVIVDHIGTSQHQPLSQLPETCSISQQRQSSIEQAQQQSNSGNIIEKQLLIQQHLTTNYIHDHYQHILRPLALSFTKYAICFVLVFCLLKIFWVYEEILQRKDLQEQYLRSIMLGKMTEVKTQCQQVFAFLDQTQDLMEMERNDVVIADSVSNCSEMDNNKYTCSSNQMSTQYLLSIDSNYDLFSLEIAALMDAHVNITNVFVINLNTLSLIQFNLTTILYHQLSSSSSFIPLINANQMLYQQSDNMQYSHINMFVNFLNITYNNTNNNSSSSSKLFTSYLDASRNSYQQSYELYQIFLFDQQSVTQQLLAAPYKITNNKQEKMWNLYCLNLVPTYLSMAFPSKLCASIKKSPSQKHNIFYVNSNSTKILITNSTFITSFQDTDPSAQVNQLFSDFITSKVQVLYPQYSLNGEAILECLNFQQGFYEHYSQNEDVDLQIFRCSSTTYMHMLVSQYIFSWGHLTTNPVPYSNLLPVAFYNSTASLQIYLFFLSNITYYSEIHNISTHGVFIIELTIKLYLAILTLALFTFQLSTNSIFTIKKLAKVVLNVDDVEKAENQFKKIVKEIEYAHTLPYTPILGTIIGYLQKFLWIKKLYHNDKKFSQHKFKKYNILFQGLKLFKYLNVDAQFPEQKKSILETFYQSKKEVLSKNTNKSNPKSKSQTVGAQQNQQLTEFVIKDNYIHHSGVLMYIYRELAYLQKEKINKFKNIQTLTRKRKSSNMRSQKIDINQDTGRDRNKNQSESIKSIQIEKNSQEGSYESKEMISCSSKRTKKKQVTMKNILRQEGSVLGSIKFNHSSDKQSIVGNNSSVNLQLLYRQLSIARFSYTNKQALQQILEPYQCIIHYYEQMVDIQQSSLNHSLQFNTIPIQQMQLRANIIYAIELKRVKIMHQYLQLLIDERVYGEEEVDFEELEIDVGYERLVHYERVYEIEGKLVEEGKLWKMKVDIVLGKSISYKKLQQLLDSDNTQVALQANLLYAQQLHKLKPFLDYEVINSIYTSLLLHDTSTQYKQYSLQLLIDTLKHSNPTTFTQQIQQLQSIKKYYNRRHKKFYFIADMTEAFDIFTPILTKIYELMNEMDVMEVYNLAMNQVAEDIRLTKEIIKPQTVQAFLSLFQQLTLQKFKSKQKEKGSSKNIHKKYIYEKDFNQILDEIQKDQTQYSSFIVVVLGGDQLSSHSLIITDDADSSSNQRQFNQLLHSEINRKISQNYYHMISIGTHLNNFLTKQGKLKKHIKNSPDLLEIDLIKKNMTQHFSLLEKFLE